MTTLGTKAGTNNQNNEAPKTESAPAPAVELSTGTAALITEQQVLLGSAGALAPAPARHRNVAAELSSKVRAMFTRPEKSHAPKHYPQRFTYLEGAAMSREMDRL